MLYERITGRDFVRHSVRTERAPLESFLRRAFGPYRRKKDVPSPRIKAYQQSTFSFKCPRRSSQPMRQPERMGSRAHSCHNELELPQQQSLNELAFILIPKMKWLCITIKIGSNYGHQKWYRGRLCSVAHAH